LFIISWQLNSGFSSFRSLYNIGHFICFIELTYRIYIRVYLQVLKKIVLMQPETGYKEKLVTKYGLSESAFQNKSSGGVHISALNSVMLLFAQPLRRHKIEKNRSAKVVT